MSSNNNTHSIMSNTTNTGSSNDIKINYLMKLIEVRKIELF